MFTGQVKLTICEAKELRVTEFMSRHRIVDLIDPYVTIDVDDESKDRTQTKVKTFEPKWDECFDFRVHQGQTLGLKVFHTSTVGTDDFVADASLNFEDIINDHQSTADLWVIKQIIRYYFYYNCNEINI